MISRTEKAVCLFLLSVILIGSSVFCFYTAASAIYKYLTQGGRDNCGEITEGVTIVQDLPYENGYLGYSFLISTYGHKVSGELNVRGIGKQTGVVYIDKTIPGFELHNNEFVDFLFPEDIPSESETITVIITSSSSPTSGLTFLTSGINSLPDHRFFINREELERDLVTRCIRMPKHSEVIRVIGVLAAIAEVFSLFIMLKAPERLKDRFLIVVRYFIILFFFCFFLYLFHDQMTLISDDWRNIVAYGRSLAAVKVGFTSRYYGNGRFLTDGLAFIFYIMPFSWWKIFDIAVYVLLLIKLWTLFTDRTLKMLTVCSVLIVLFPVFSFMASAGFIATTTNYIYTIVALLLGITPLIQISKNKPKIHILTFIISVIGLIYASNHEQTAIIGIAVFLIAAVVSGKQLIIDHNFEFLKLFRVSCFYLVFTLILFIFMMNTPGHIVRTATTNEITAYLPQFAGWSLPFKIYKGMTTTFAYIFFEHITLFRIYCLVLTAVVFVRSRKKAIYSAMLIAVLVFIEVMSEFHKFIIYPSYGFGLPDFDQFYKHPESLFLSILILLLILLSILVLRESDRNLCITLLGLFVTGFGTRVMMGLSPTLFASNLRTFTALLFCFIVSIIIMVQNLVNFAGDADRSINIS